MTLKILRPGEKDVQTQQELADVRARMNERTSNMPVPTDEEILDCLVNENGIPMRVCTVLNTTEQHVWQVVTRNARQLSTRMRAVLMTRTFTTMLKVDAALHVALENMPADSVGRTYGMALSAFTNLAGQFEEGVAVDTDDDADSVKEELLGKLDRMGVREQLEQEQREATG